MDLAQTLQIAAAILAGLTVAFVLAGLEYRWPEPLLKITEKDTALAGEAAQVFGFDAVPNWAMIVAYILAAVILYLVGTLLLGSAIVALLFVPVAIVIPKVLLNYLLQRRWLQIEAQLPYAVDQIVSAVRSAKPLGTAIGVVAEGGVMPVGHEFERIAREQKLGIGLVEALDRHGRSVPSLHFKMVDAALALFARQGGEIAEPLTEMSKSFKEIWKLDQKIRTSSSQARMNFLVVNGGAAFMLLMIFLGQPELIDKVFSSVIGIVVFAVGVLLYAIGFFWMRAMMRISV